MIEHDIRAVRTRRDMIRFLDGYAFERKEELDERRLRGPLVKSYLVEILDNGHTRSSQGLIDLFARWEVQLKQIDDDLFLVRDNQNGSVGFLERLRPRIAALYSTMETKALDAWARRLVLRAPEIDHVWLSGLTFSVLWDLVVRLSHPDRFTRLVFTHESIYDIDVPPVELSQEDEGEIEAPDTSQDEEVEEVTERRAANIRLVDRIRVIRDKLQKLQDIYAPLHAISQLRFPSLVGRGGHDFYDNGKVTNRSESFRDHRSHLLFVVRIYERLLGMTEEQAWYSVQTSASLPGVFRKIVGAPVVIHFQEPLKPQVFDFWVQSTFGRQRNRFRLWGHPIRLGPTKVHVYGLDCHLWHPLFLELTARGCTAIIPSGTCGNTVHRLVTNVQRYLDPGAEVYIGDTPYRKIVEESSRTVEYASAS